MIIKDEEHFLEECINHVRDITDEIIIVVDSRSSDKSREIAKNLGAKVFDFEWKDDFSAIRNFSLDNATSNWILVLDADERLDEEGKDRILSLINDPENALKDSIGFKLEQRTYRPKKGAPAEVTTDKETLSRIYDGHETAKAVRLFRNCKKTRYRNKVHELVGEPA